MGTHVRNKISMDAADSLLCWPFKPSRTPPPTEQPYNDPEFEFGTPTPDNSVEDFSRNNHSVTVLSNNQMLHHATFRGLKQYEMETKPNDRGSIPDMLTKSKGSSHRNRDSRKILGRSHSTKDRKKGTKEKTASRSGFGRKFLQPFAFPCKECHAVEPKVKMNTAGETNVKKH